MSRAKELVLGVFLTTFLFQAAAQNGLVSPDVFIDAVNPSRGSIAGGSRLHIQGRGFSTSTGVGNLVFIGPYKCDPIPLHSTASQIACKTQSAMTGMWDEWYGWTGPLQVVVVVAGKVSQCSTSRCTFEYHYGWYHTPRIYSVQPVAVKTGDLITVNGRFHPRPFDFELLNAPSQEVPLASVKIANREGEQQQPQNEPFGQSGTRCGLFDPAVEEPYGVVTATNGNEVSQFLCAVNGPREGGRYNLSVALLGTAMDPDSEMNMGESQVQSSAYLVDHMAVSFMVHQTPSVFSVYPKASGMLGGARLTIQGDAFSRTKDSVQVTVGGVKCHVTFSAVEQMICVLDDYASDSGAAGDLIPGDLGVRMKLWYNQGCQTFENFRVSEAFSNETFLDVDEVLFDRFETPRNIEDALGLASGPIGRLQSFFRVPKSGRYSFIHATDDLAELYMGSGEHDLEKIIDSTAHVSFRDFSRTLENTMNYRYATRDRVQQHTSRMSSKIALQEGEHTFLEAWYRSCSGGDSFSLGAILHDTDANRKDSPFAIDEKQFIVVETQPSFEVHNITVVGQSAGTFRLQLGSKLSRPIGLKADELEMAAAVRELLSNCEGSIGDVADASGNSLTCFQGHGIDYRGFASTTVDGEECKPWNETSYWDPTEAITNGLEGNFCRNPITYPTWRWEQDSDGPWCFNSNNRKTTCMVPRCGGNSTMAGPIPLLATFEDLEDGAEAQAWLSQNGHRPTIDSSTAFCGLKSLHFENNGMRLWNLWKQDPTKGSASHHWSQEWPWMCMAYRIPPDSIVEMIVNMEFPWYRADGSRVYTEVTVENPVSTARWRNKWTSITLTNAWTQWTKIGEWGVIADDEWHYACIDVHELLEQSGIAEFHPGSNVEIREIRFQGAEPGSTYSTHEFWIDEFSISKAPRTIERPGFPDLGGAHAKLVGVSREEVGDSVSWQLQITPDDCRDQLALDLDVIDPTDASWADAKRVKEHAPALDGELVVSFRGEFASFSSYATAEEVEQALEGISSIGKTSVTRTGTCQTGYSWLVSFSHIPGDIELLQISTEMEVDAYVVGVEDGGLLMAPLSADYFHVPVNKSAAGVSVVVNDGTGRCLSEDACSFSFRHDLTPTVTSVSQEPHGAVSGVFNLTIAGTGLSAVGSSEALDSVLVDVSGTACKVTLVSDTVVECFLAIPFLPAGLHPVTVTVDGRGRAHGSATFAYPLHVEAVSPSSFTLATPRTLALSGYGFDPVLSQNKVVVAGITCAVVSVTAAELQCLLRGSGVSAGLVSLEVMAGNSTFQSSALITFVEFSSPTIESITPSYGTAGGGDRVMIVGSNFGEGGGVAVTVGGADCSISESNGTQIVCTTTAGPIGTQELVVDTEFNGEVAAAFEFVLDVSDVSPKHLGLGGGAMLEVEGRGFVSESGAQGQPMLKVPGTEVYVVGVYSPALLPEVHEIALIATSVNEVQRVTAGNASFFALSIGSVRSEPLPNGVDPYVLAAELNTLLSEGSVRARRITSSSGEYTWLVEFFGDVGDVALMHGHACMAASASSCSAGGVTVSEVVKGQSPSGHFALSTTAGGHARVSAAATSLDMEAAFAQLPISGGVAVLRTRDADRLAWKVTYTAFEGKRDLPVVNSSGLGGTGTVVVRRLAEGTEAPAGEWQMSLGGKVTGAMPANASEELVLNEIKDSFPGFSNVNVIRAANQPGRFLNRAYPQQWAIRFSRQGVAGLGIDRCTNPLFVDWDPAACPSVAADLFLSHYPWYWPTRIPKPADQGTEGAQETLQALCDQEARGRNLRPGFCQAKVPAETLPPCGEGSGVNPPCWSERFTTASIRLLDGKQVLFKRDDSESPSDTTKGYRFWQRLDIAALEAANALTVNSTIVQLGAGVHVDRVFSRAEQRVLLEPVEPATFTKIKTRAPDMTPYLTSYEELVSSDTLYAPAFTWNLGGDGPPLVGRAARDRHGTNTSCTDTSVGAARRLLTLSEGSYANSSEGSYANANSSEYSSSSTFSESWGSFSTSSYSFSSSAASSGSASLLGSGDGSVYSCEAWEAWDSDTPTPVSESGWQYGAEIPFSSEVNGDHFTVDGWFVLYEKLPGIIISSIELASHAGYAVTFSGCKIEFLLRTQSGSSTGFSVVSVDSPPLGQWVHVSASWDGQHQRLYLQGELVASTRLSGRFLKNRADPAMIGAACKTEGGAQWCPGGRSWPARSPRDMEVADVLWYDTALSAGAIRGHAAAADVVVKADVGVEVSNVPAACAGACAASFAAGNTSVISSISPAAGYDGMRLRIFGEGFRVSNNSCDLEVAVGEHACELAHVADSWLECVIRVVSSGTLTGPQLVTGSSIYGRFLGAQQAFVLASAITDLAPRHISLLGGARLHIFGKGFPELASRVSVLVGPTPCAISSLSSDLIICQMGLREESDIESYVRVRALVDGVDAICGMETEDCELEVKASSTPALHHVSSYEVEEGQSMLLSGAFPTDEPSISIGTAPCNVSEYNATHIVCSVGAGKGGRALVLVRFNTGFALSSGDSPIELKYKLRVSSVSPSTGSVHGGQRLVIRGTGFSSVPDRNFVFVGGRKARVLSGGGGELIVETRREGPPEVGLEKSILSVVCGGPGQGSCDLALQTCTQTMFDGALESSVKSKMLVVSPQQPLMEDTWLIDSDPNTIWRAPRDADEQLIALDLGAQRKISAVNLHWAGISCGEVVVVSVGNNCQSITEVANMTVASGVWDQVTVVQLPNATDARFVFVTLLTRKEHVQYFRIRDLVVVEQTVQESVSVTVDGFASTCSGTCQYVGDASPELFMISPAAGESGLVVNVSASGLNATDCEANVISIGGGRCIALSCSHSWQACEVPALPAGEHRVTLFVLGVGNAAHLSPVTFTYHLTVLSVTPPQAGLGGGALLRLNGDGFAEAASVRVCGSECAMVEGNASSLRCRQGPALDVASTKDVGQQVFLTSISRGVDDVVEDVRSGHIRFGGESIGFQITNYQDWSREKMFLRFRTLDIAQGRKIEEARLNIRAGPGLCAAGTKIRVWAELADDSKEFNVARRGSLGSRPVTSTFVDWVMDKSWKWPAEAIESVDISDVLNEVIGRPGWRSGGAVTLVLQQEKGAFSFTTADQHKCSVLTAEYGGAFYAPRLRIELSTTSALVLPSDLDCAVAVTVATERHLESCAPAPLVPVSVTASSESAPEYGYKVWEKEGKYLLHKDATDFCTRMGAQLCLRDEIFDQSAEGQPPFFYDRLPEDGTVTMVPTFHVEGNGMQHFEKWMSVSSDLTVDAGVVWWPAFGGQSADNEQLTRFLPCCGQFEHTARMTVDGDTNTMWKSDNDDNTTLTLDFGEDAASISHLELRWASGWASSYLVLGSMDGVSWSLLHAEDHGDGARDDISFVGTQHHNLAVRYLRISMLELGGSGGQYSLTEVIPYGCSLEPQYTTVVEGANVSATLFSATQSLTPMVWSVTPSRGTTAGGSTVTIVGRFWSDHAADLSVQFGDFDCGITSVQSSGEGIQTIECLTSASGVTNGGVKYVIVNAKDLGSSFPMANATFWYIDAWSASTTWGGGSPPVGCGDWVDDPDCTDTVVIPEGQVVLLDVNLPRFYLILIEGTLMFDRADIEMSANYILIRGGTLQIGTELEPFMQKAKITMYGHPKSIDLPTFGAKVIACYECTLDIHGAPQVAWTTLNATVYPRDTDIVLTEPVAWPVGSKIVIATTDFESPRSSHSEVATVVSLSEGGRRVSVGDIGVCSEYSFSGLPTKCSRRDNFTFTHLGETRIIDGRTIHFRAEVGLLSRNILIEGDADKRLCPLAETAEDHVTLLSCVQFGAQIFLHSPGHESLVARLSNFEIRNAGQAFRLGRYAIHWHMIGNLRESYQRNCSVHHSWNRGTAIHGVHYLRLEHNFLYNIMGHTVFIEDGVEEYNQVIGNLGIKTIPSMSLLNTDQTPAVFWIVTGANYVINNHAVASRRYGFWFRPEMSATGTSVNTPDVHPINIPLLDGGFDGNEAHSNGKYGLRVFDIYKPNERSVFKNTFVWRNGAVGWTATVIGKVAFEGMISIQNGHHIFESRATDVSNWDDCYIADSLFADYVDPPLPLETSYSATADDFGNFEVRGGDMHLGILLPWNEAAGGGMSIRNCTFVNFKNPCIRGCAHCGRGGSPFFGDGAFETRFSGMRFVNSSERVLLRHPNEGFFYDLDGTLTGTGRKENYTQGGDYRGASFVGRSTLLPPGYCADSDFSTHGTGGAVCEGLVFRRMWYHIKEPEIWVGKALCVRRPDQSTINTCQSLQPECNCLPYLKKAWTGNVWLAAEGYRYNVQMDLLPHELADPERWQFQVWDTQPNEHFYFSQRMLQWDIADKYGRPLYWSDAGGGYTLPDNYFVNETACTYVGCGMVEARPDWTSVDYDMMGTYLNGSGRPGDVPIPERDSNHRRWTVKTDADDNGAIHTIHVRGPSTPWASHRAVSVRIKTCPNSGCWPPPPPPPRTGAVTIANWSDPTTWRNLTDDPANPLVTLEFSEGPSADELSAVVSQSPRWAGSLPGAGDDVWIPWWKTVILDVSTPLLGHLVIEGTLVINASTSVNLSATWIEIKGGALIIATTDEEANVVGPYTGSCFVKLFGTNPKLAAIHGSDPRETPELIIGREGVAMGPGVLGVMGKLVAKGNPVSHSWVALASSAAAGDTSVVVEGEVDWQPGVEIVLSPTDFDMHEADVARIASVTWNNGNSVLTLVNPLEHPHFAGGTMQFGTRSIEIRSRVGLLTHNIVFTGSGEGEETPYTSWNSQLPVDAADAVCPNSQCENGETSETCPQDCIGPAHEYGAGLLIAAYTEDYTSCTSSFVCTTGYRRDFHGTADLSHVEFRYYGQNNLRPGVQFQYVQQGNTTLDSVSFNRGYFSAVWVDRASNVVVENSVFYRSHLPTLQIVGGSRSVGNIITRNLGIVGIFWNTHRGATQGKGLDRPKLDAMIGMFHDDGTSTIFNGNVAAGSERAGFTSPGVECDDAVSFVGNEAHSCLAGFWFNQYLLRGRACTAVTGFRAWKIYEYAVYGEVPSMSLVKIDGLKSADARVGVNIIVVGADALSHVRKDQRVSITNSLLVGHSDNGNCQKKVPGLHTCKFYMAWCNHVGPHHAGVYISSFLSGANMAPKIKPWFDGGAYASLFGQTDLDGVTFANFGQPCSEGPRAGKWDHAVSGLPPGAGAADGWHPLTLKNMELVNVATLAKVNLQAPNPKWINQADCIDMDCDGPKHALVRDEDGTFLEESSGGTILPRGEVFSAGSFFLSPYKDDINIPQNQEWWYPTVPSLMRTTKAGELVNVSDTWTKRGFGHSRRGCSLIPEWNAWRCPTSTSYRRLVIESMDRDHEIRRISPVALSSSDGYTDMLNGCMDHGWCFSYTCLKRLMTFWGVVATGLEYTVHFTGSNPQTMRVSLPNAEAGESIVLKIYYSTAQKMQIFVDGRFIEDVNREDGKEKTQLVRDGRWASNNVDGGYTPQYLSVECSCLLGDECKAVDSASAFCQRRGDTHGANMWNRAEGLLEIVIAAHSMDKFIEIKSMPVMAVSMSLSTTPADFYQIKDAFLSNMAALLGIDVKRIAVVDVRAGNARRRRRLLSAEGDVVEKGAHGRRLLQVSGTSVDVEISSDPEVSPQNEDVYEDSWNATVLVIRETNIYDPVSVDYSTTDGVGLLGAIQNVHYLPVSGTLNFAQYETEKRVTIPIIPVLGHSIGAYFFQLTLSSPINATLKKTNARVRIYEVHSPAPAAPVQAAAPTGTQLTVQWNAPVWTIAPLDTTYSDVVEYELRKRLASNGSAWELVTLDSATVTQQVVTNLPAFSPFVFSVRARTIAGWTDWSEGSERLRTRAVCGDGKRQGTEGCDVGSVSGIGCVACVVLGNFSCSGLNPDVCAAGCGDGIRSVVEGCDDGNKANNDGCNAACEIEQGWFCVTPLNSKTLHCNTTCGDGIKAGDEDCDAGENNNMGHGCTDCVKAAGAVCEEDEDLLSTCKVCGNSRREADEGCDDGGESGGCSGCSIVAGWRCQGGSSQTRDRCIAGPSEPDTPSADDVTDASIAFSWTPPSGNGVAILDYFLEYFEYNSTNSFNATTPIPSFTLTGLRSATEYVMRVRARTAVGAGNFSAFSPITTTSAAPASNALDNAANTISSDPLALVAGVTVGNESIQLTGLEVEAPPAEPEAPVDAPLLTEDEYAAILAAANGSNVEVTGENPTAQETAEPATNSIFFGDADVGFSDRILSVDVNTNLQIFVRLSKQGDDTTKFGGSFLVLTADYNSESDTAISGQDFDDVSGTLVFQALVVQNGIQVFVHPGRRTFKYPRTFRVVLVRAGVAGSGRRLLQSDAVQLHDERWALNVTIQNPDQYVEVLGVTSYTNEVKLSNGQGYVVPGGFLQAETVLSIERSVDPPPMPAGDLILVSDVLNLGPAGLQFPEPVSLFINMDTVVEGRVNVLHFYNESSGEWIEQPLGRWNSLEGMKEDAVTRFGTYALFARICPVNAYQDRTQGQFCASCPAFSTSAEGSTTVENCTCADGYIGNIYLGCFPIPSCDRSQSDCSTSASPGCPIASLGDRTCDIFCMTEEARFDSFDCFSLPGSRGRLLQALTRADSDFNEVISFEEAEALGRSWGVSIDRQKFATYDVKLESPQGVPGLDWYEVGLLVQPVLALDDVSRTGNPGQTFMAESAIRIVTLIDVDQNSVASFEEFTDLYDLTNESFRVLQSDSESNLVTMPQLMSALSDVALGLLCYEVESWMNLEASCKTAILVADYNHDGAISVAEATILGFSERIFADVDIDGNGLLTSVELYNRIRANNDNGCRCRQHIDDYNGTIDFEAPVVRFAGSPCKLLVMPEWNYELEDVAYSRKESTTRSKRHQAMRPPPPQLRKTGQPAAQTTPTLSAAVRKRKSAHKQRLSSPRATARRLLSHTATETEGPAPPEPNAPYPFLVSLQKPQTRCAIDHYLPEDTCETPPWLLWQDLEHLVTEPGGLSKYDTCLPAGNFLEAARTVGDAAPDFITEADIEAIAFRDLEDSFLSIDWEGSGLIFDGGYSEFQEVAKFLFPTGVENDVNVAHIQAMPREDGQVYFEDTQISAYWWAFLVTAVDTPCTENCTNASSTENDGNPSWCNCTAICSGVASVIENSNQTNSSNLTNVSDASCNCSCDVTEASAPSSVDVQVIIDVVTQAPWVRDLVQLTRGYLGCPASNSSNSSTPTRRLFALPRDVPLEVEFGDWFHYCSGALVAPNRILTAAFCVGDDVDDVIQFDRVRIGGNTTASGIDYRISSVRVHPLYTSVYHDSSALREFDVAILELETPVPSTDALPVRMYDGLDLGYTDCKNLMLQALGFGEWRGATEVERLANGECDEEKYQELGYRGSVTPPMLCTISSSVSDEQFLDIGSPVIATPSHLSKDSFTLVGLVSVIETVAQRQIHTRITAARQWILAVLGRRPAKTLAVSFDAITLAGDSTMRVVGGVHSGGPATEVLWEACDPNSAADKFTDGGAGGLVLEMHMPTEVGARYSFSADLRSTGCGTECERADASNPRTECDSKSICRRCALPLTWRQLTQLGAQGKAFYGGLGLEKAAPYSHWACVRDWDVDDQLACAARSGEFVCFKFNTRTQEFDYDNMNKYLGSLSGAEILAAKEAEIKPMATLLD